MEQPQNKDQMLFTNLVIMFQTAAMQHMGKIKNPISDKIERDIEQAKISIDLLDMLERKTKGNLEEYESKLLKSVLQDLRLNYVQERDKKDEESKQTEGNDQKAEDEQSTTDEMKKNDAGEETKNS